MCIYILLYYFITYNTIVPSTKPESLFVYICITINLAICIYDRYFVFNRILCGSTSINLGYVYNLNTEPFVNYY